MRGFCAILAATSFAAGAAMASDDDWPELKANRLKDAPPQMAFAAYRASGASTGVSIYTADKDRIVARRVDGDRGVTYVHWADTSGCPALSKALDGLSSLKPPKLGRPRKSNVSGADTGGDSFMLWSGDAASQFELRMVSGSPLGRWIDATLTATAKCWRPEAPR